MVRNDAGERPVDARAHRRAGAHFVLHAFEVDDVRVDGDADRHDDAGDAGEAQHDRDVEHVGQEPRDQRVERHAAEQDAGDHDEAEQPVEDQHVDAPRARGR